MLTVTESARKKVIETLEQEGRKGQGLRVTAQSGGCSGLQYSLNFVEGDGPPDDVVVPVEGFRLHLDPVSASVLEGGTIDYLETLQGAGFKIDTPKASEATPPAKPQGPQAEAVEKLLEEVINPGVSSHGGWVSLVDVKDNVVFLRLGGGCQGCGMVDVTLKQGIEGIIKDQLPEIVAVYDVTDHADGKNPYYQPSKH
jgi:Fe/S biogenesis protein NfuA